MLVVVFVFSTDTIVDFVRLPPIETIPGLFIPSAVATLMSSFRHAEGAKAVPMAALASTSMASRTVIGVPGTELLPSPVHFVEVLSTGIEVRQLHRWLIIVP